MTDPILLPKKSWQPLETLTGQVSWHLNTPPKHLELRLFWGTRGRGTEETHTIVGLDLGREATGSRPFSFTLPATPWSVDGRLVTVYWALELVEKKAGALAYEEIVVTGNGTTLPTVLRMVDLPLSGVRMNKRWSAGRK